jgi:hypothetical protein
MNNTFAEIYLAIMARIIALVPDIKYVDHNLGQLEGYSSRPEVALPCALVDFDQWNFTNLGENSQAAEGDVVVRIAFAQYGHTNNLSPEQWRLMALKYYEIEYAVNIALHGWSPKEDVGYLTRTATTSENLPQAVRVRTIRYRLAFEDYQTKPEQFTTPIPNFEASTQNEDTEPVTP